MRFFALVMIALPSLASAEITYFSDEGDEYSIAYNAHGADLTSLYPKAWPHLEPYEEHVTVRKPAVIHLGKDCDARHNEWGKGVWEWDNGGFSVAFNGGHELRFSRQELVGPDESFWDKCLWMPKDGLYWPPASALDE